MLGLVDDEDTAPAATQEAEAESESGGYADWLSDLLDEDVQFMEEVEEAGDEDLDLGLQSEQLPDWLLGQDTTPFQGVEAEDDEDSQDWLGAVSDAAEVPTEASPRAPLPDWLAETAEPGGRSLTVEPEERAQPLPDWLNPMQPQSDPAPRAARTQPEAPEPASFGDSFGWLLGEEADGESSAGEAKEEAGGAGADLSDWLTEAHAGDREAFRGGSADQAAAARPPAVDQSEAAVSFDLPDWLANVGGSATGQTGDIFDDEVEVPPDAEAETELPDWLANVGGTATGQTGNIFDDEAEVLFDAEAEAELPDWLANVGGDAAGQPRNIFDDEAEAPSDADTEASLPDWLHTLSAEEDEADVPAVQMLGFEPQTAEPQTAEAPLAAAELPDWLSDIGGEAAGGQARVFTTPSDMLEPTLSESEGPSWLENVAEDRKGALPASAVPAFYRDEDEEEPSIEEEVVEAPEWLQSLELHASEDIADLSSANLSSVDAALDRANLPTWLQDLRPPEAGGETGRGGANDAGPLVPADIPDWVQALRPEAGERGKGTRDRGGWATLAEPEGPLVGLPGVLSGLVMVDVPPQTDVVSDHTIPEAVVKQAQLWQHLLEQPRSGERAITHATRRSHANPLVRAMVFLVLVLSLFAAILLLPVDVQFSQTTPQAIAPGAAAFVESLERVQPGQQVIVAVEYTLPYADEMDQIAVPVLEHLDDREASVIFVSTIPEGTALGMHLADQVRYQGVFSDGGYLAGNLNGIASFMQTSEARSAQHLVVLTSQSERLRWWVEQVTVNNTVEQGRRLPFSAGVTASVRPLVSPYLQTEGVQGWVAGYAGGLAYRQSRGETLTGFHIRTWDVLMLGHWFIAALLFIGLLYSLITGKKGAQ